MTWPNSHFPCEEKGGVRPPQSLPARGHSSGQIHQTAGQTTSPQQRFSIRSRAKRFPFGLLVPRNQEGKPSARPAPFPSSSLSFPSRVEDGPESCVTAKAQDFLTRVSAPLRASSCLILHRAAAAAAAAMGSTPDSHEMNGLTTAIGNGNGDATPPEEVRGSISLSRRAGQEDKNYGDRALLLGRELGEGAPGAWDSSASRRRGGLCIPRAWFSLAETISGRDLLLAGAPPKG